MILDGPQIRLRPWSVDDVDALVRHADDREIWRHLTDRFPHPYQLSDAQEWIAIVSNEGDPTRTFAIEMSGEPVGAVGLIPQVDLRRQTAEVGYWVSRNHWGRGIATEALRLLSAHAFSQFDFVRLEALVIDGNPASCRVLEKAGYAFESRQRQGICKAGQIKDGLIYALLRDEWASTV